MWALVEDSKVTKVYTRPTAITINDTQYPANIMSSWTATQLKAIGLYEVIIDNSNYKNPEYYMNTNQEFAFASNKVTATYGKAKAMDLDTLKTQHKQTISNQAYGLLQPNDWLVVRKQEAGTDIPSDWSTYRSQVRASATSMQAKIEAAGDVDALAALYVYNDADPPVRPMGEFPTPPE